MIDRLHKFQQQRSVRWVAREVAMLLFFLFLGWLAGVVFS